MQEGDNIDSLMLGETDNIVWSLRDDKLLRYAVETFGVANWLRISKTVGKRTPSQCQGRWAYMLARDADTKDPKKGTWSIDEDEMLRQLMEAVPHRNWGDVAALIPGRSAKQCRERWCYNLDPSINKDVWTDDEDKVLLENQRKLGNRWAFIASMLPGRTENAVKTRFKSIMRAKRREWHQDEDITIIEMHRQVGSKWDKIAEKLPNRTKNAVRTRYRQLMKEAKGIQEAPNEFGNYGKRAAIMKRCNELQKKLGVEELLLQLGDHCISDATKQGLTSSNPATVTKGNAPTTTESQATNNSASESEKSESGATPAQQSPTTSYNQALAAAAQAAYLSHPQAQFFYPGQQLFNPATGRPYMYPFYPAMMPSMQQQQGGNMSASQQQNSNNATPPPPQQQQSVLREQQTNGETQTSSGKDQSNATGLPPLAPKPSGETSSDMPAPYSQQDSTTSSKPKARRGSKRTALDKDETQSNVLAGSLWAVAAAADSLDKQDASEGAYRSNLVYPSSANGNSNTTATLTDQCSENAGITFGNMIRNVVPSSEVGHVAKKRRPSVQEVQEVNAISSLRSISASPVQT